MIAEHRFMTLAFCLEENVYSYEIACDKMTME